MSEIVIRVENLGKMFRIGAKRERYRTFRDALAGLWRRSGSERSSGTTPFWALKHVSFEIRRGEVVGVIGRNGAGKSTLLKVLSRITEPTEGFAEIRGRVRSLLEVGTGFHPELTGRENVFLNGAILGMQRAEIEARFDEIVTFAEIEQFLDTPVKHYSSGMYLRLAFAVAAHLEPEILIVDEVLAVGDAEFQKKCLGKMEEVARGGRTVVFVSHNMEAVDRLTSRCLSLSDGRLSQDGKTSDVVGNYLRGAERRVGDLACFRVSAIPRTVALVDLWAETPTGEKAATFRQGEPFRIVLRVTSHERLKCDFAIVIESSQQHALYTTHLSDLSEAITTNGSHLLAAELQNPMLRKGQYLVSVAAFSPDLRLFYDVVHHFPLLEVAGTRDKSFPEDARWGALYVPVRWNVSN
jgi:lipopolysaccharide transport system ATP-binding protein